MKQMVKKVHYKISQDLFIRDKKHHESGVFYFPKILLKNKCCFLCKMIRIWSGIWENKWEFKKKVFKIWKLNKKIKKWIVFKKMQKKLPDKSGKYVSTPESVRKSGGDS